MFEIARSPIVLALISFVSASLIAAALLPDHITQRAVDCYCIAAAVAVLWAYRRTIIDVLRQRRPDRADLMVAGIVLVAIGYGVLRAIRLVVLDLTNAPPSWIGNVFYTASVVLVFGAFLHIAATGRVNGTIRPSAWWAILAAGWLGTLLTLIVYAIRAVR